MNPTSTLLGFALLGLYDPQSTPPDLSTKGSVAIEIKVDAKRREDGFLGTHPSCRIRELKQIDRRPISVPARCQSS